VITGKDIFTDRLYEQTFRTNAQVHKPIVTEQEYSCSSVEGKVLVLNTPELKIRRDIRLPKQPHLKAVEQSIQSILNDKNMECIVKV